MRILITESQYKSLEEALPLSVGKEYTERGKYRSDSVVRNLNKVFENLKNLSPDVKTSKRGDRVYFPIMDNNLVNDDSLYIDTITEFLNDNGYYVDDYKKGIASEINNEKRKVNIGKLLYRLKRQDLLDDFSSDPARTNSKEVSTYIVFSKHPYDVAGMSTNRGWSSCMNLEDGSNSQYVMADVEEGTIVVYHIKSTDLNITRPIARLLVKPYINFKNSDDILYVPEGKTYGTTTMYFEGEVADIFNKIQKNKFGEFKFNGCLYADSMMRYISKIDVDSLIKDPKEIERKKTEFDKETVLKILIKAPELIPIFVNIGDYLDEQQLYYLFSNNPSLIKRVSITSIKNSVINHIFNNDNFVELRPYFEEHYKRVKSQIETDRVNIDNLSSADITQLLCRYPELKVYIPRLAAQVNYVRPLMAQMIKCQPSLARYFDSEMFQLNTIMEILYFRPELCKFYKDRIDEIIRDWDFLSTSLRSAVRIFVNTHPKYKSYFSKLYEKGEPEWSY